jgi:hypothetical protein
MPSCKAKKLGKLSEKRYSSNLEVGSPTVSGGFVRLVCRAKKPLGEGARAYGGRVKAPLCNPTGKWSHPVYGEMEITTSDIAECVHHVRNDLPITAGHDHGMSGGELTVIGCLKELIDRGVNGLYAVVTGLLSISCMCSRPAAVGKVCATTPTTPFDRF